MKKVLILGGTQFIGRNLVERLLELGEYEITLFNRQRTQSHLFPNVNRIKGDRETDDIKQIAETQWDFIIDVSCFYPDALARALECITDINKYIFISTCSVYDNENVQALLRNEGAKILPCNESQKTDRTTASYGNRKAECERILKDSGLPYVILRPALVFGKYDLTDRLYYWLHQVKTKDVLLLPENGERLFSTTYVLDLVEAVVCALKQNTTAEVFNVISNPKTSIKQIVDGAKEVLNTEYKTINASADFLKKQDIAQWMDMPLWINGDFFTYNNEKVRNDLGAKPTEFNECLNATIQHYDELGWPEPKYGISEVRRQELLNENTNEK